MFRSASTSYSACSSLSPSAILQHLFLQLNSPAFLQFPSLFPRHYCHPALPLGCYALDLSSRGRLAVELPPLSLAEGSKSIKVKNFYYSFTFCPSSAIPLSSIWSLDEDRARTGIVIWKSQHSWLWCAASSSCLKAESLLSRHLPSFELGSSHFSRSPSFLSVLYPDQNSLYNTVCSSSKDINPLNLLPAG